MEREEIVTPGIAGVIDLAAQVDDDGAKPAKELRRRDREIGRELASLKNAPRKQILAWLARVLPPGRPRLGEQVAGLLRIGTLLLVLAGLVLGWLAAAAVYYYDGSRPVNVVHVLAVFVAAQLFLILLLLLTLVSPAAIRRLPVVGALLQSLELLRPGRLQKLAARHLPPSTREGVTALLGSSRAHRILFGDLERWAVTLSSQVFAVAFNCGALCSCLYLILFSDLAFAWSTTLQVSAGDVHSLTGTLAAPWSILVPDAVPSLSLVEASRYYRLNEGVLSSPAIGTGDGPALLGGWWPFLVMSMLCYGLMPRLALWAFARWRLARAVDRTLLHLPGISDVLDRMNRELVETRARDAEAAGTGPGEDLPGSSPSPRKGAPCTLVNWASAVQGGEALSPWAARSWGCVPAAVLDGGGANTLEEDESIVERAAGTGGGVIIFVRAWEPPLEEFLDFLREMRAALPEDAPIIVAPVGPGRGPEPGTAAPDQVSTWAAVLGGLGDPWLSVQSPGKEGGSQ